MEHLEQKDNFNNRSPILNVFGFMGISCFTICAIISLIIGVGWLMSNESWILDGEIGWVETAIPVVLIIWGLFPVFAAIYLFRRWQQRT